MLKFLKQFITTLKPNKNLFFLVIGLFFLACIVAFLPDYQWFWWLTFAIGIALILWDLIRLYGIRKLTCERELAGRLSLGLWHDVTLTFHYEATEFSTGELHLDVFDHYPVNCEYRDLPQHLILQSGQWTKLNYAIKPLKRGDEIFPSVQCLLHSPWSFWLKNQLIPCHSSAMVYPNFAAISQYSILAMENHLSQLGIRKIRRRGEGMDFNQLREFREGDSIKQIDWKATSRLRKLISREYQDEKDQEIIFLLDCGRRMLSHDGELSHFDHALNAMLLLSYIALHQGDAVGFNTFATTDNEHLKRWFPARKSMATIHSILNNVYDLHACTQTPDYTQGITDLLLRQKKRALVIVLTNLRDEDNQDLLNALKLLTRKHLVILASLKEQLFEQINNKPINDFSDALLFASSCDYQAQRQKMLDNLSIRGINYLDVPPDKLAVSLVNRYLDIKSSGQL